MKRSLLVLSLLLLTLGVGCATGSSSDSQTRQSGLSTIILSAATEDGESVELQLSNGTEQLMGANMCDIKVEVLEDDEWQPLEMEFDKTCVDEHKSIGPGSTRSATYTSSEEVDFSQNQYRFVTKVEYPMGLGFKTITSTPVEVDDGEEAPEEEVVEESDGAGSEEESAEEEIIQEEEEQPGPAESPVEDAPVEEENSEGEE